MDTAIIAIIIAVIPTALSVYLLYVTNEQKKRIDNLTTGISEGNLENIVRTYIENLRKCASDIDLMNQEFEKIRQETREFFRKIGIVRFQAFKDTGGDQSFALTLLDQENNGFVISSLYGRGFSKIYLKPIEKGKSEKYTLTDEERESLEIALNT
ncbi:DUF4446 family protein [Candidatus Dojkabacteria bacterium]|nr:DUF4446 family protein [Candidatus Dojkabacteria bacterium]